LLAGLSKILDAREVQNVGLLVGSGRMH
jgi:hypothetical protein